jgi:hypothetical protein
MKQNIYFEVTISSGKGSSIENWLEICFNSINKEWNQYITINKDFKPDYKVLISDNSLLKSIDWFPKASFKDLAKMMLKDLN